jgi:hypothetical protein
MASTYYITISMLDATGETSNFTVFHDEVTAVSLPGLLTEYTNLIAATQALGFNNVSKTLAVLQADNKGIAVPTTKYAQRENKLLFTYKSTDTAKDKKYQIAVPCVDLNKLTFVPGGKDAVLLTTTEVAAWITAFKAMASTPDDPNDNSVDVLSARFVGRNS